MHRKTRSIASLLLLSLSTPAMASLSLFAPTGAKSAAEGVEQPVVVSQRSAVESIIGEPINVAAPGDDPLWARYTDHEELPGGDLLWVGTAKTETGEKRAVIVFGEDGGFGVVPDADGKLWSLKSHSTGRSWLEPMNGTHPRPLCATGGCGAVPRTDAIPFIPSKADRANGVMMSDDEARKLSEAKTRIDLLGIYTDDVVRLYGSEDAAKTYFRSLIALTNQSFADSGINAYVEVVALVRSAHDTNMGNINTIAALSGNRLSDGLDVHALRNQYNADLVAMLRDGAANRETGGNGQLATDPNFIDYDFGYSVSAYGGYVMAHEIGHNLGAHHDVETETQPDGSVNKGAYFFAHGHREVIPRPFNTVMAYRVGQTQDQPYFSNPNIWQCRGRPCGVAGISDNAKAINLMAPRIARLRESNTQPSIADTEHLEPDANLPRDVLAMVRLPSPAPAGGLIFEAWTEDGTAKAGQDYVAMTRTRFSVAAGQRQGFISFQILPDSIREPTETFFLVAEIPGGAGSTRARAEVSILNDDPRLRLQGRLIFDGAPAPTSPIIAYIEERGRWQAETALVRPPNFEYDIGLVPGRDYSVRFDARDQAPFTEVRRSFRLDAVSRKENVIMRPGRKVNVRLRFDGAAAPTQAVRVFGWGVNGDPNAGIIIEARAPDYRVEVPVTAATPFRITVQNPPAPFAPAELVFSDLSQVNGDQEIVLNNTPTARIDDTSFNEGSTDGSLFVNVALATDSSGSAAGTWGQVTYGWRIVGGTATAGADFTGPTSGTHLIRNKEPNSFIRIPVVNDTVAEGDETIEIEIFDVQGARVTRARATATIKDDDRPTPPAIGLLNASAYEGDSGNSSLTFIARMDRVSADPVRFDIRTSDDTARSGSDYVATTLNGLVIPAGELERRFSIPITGDTVTEGPERFIVQMTNVVGARVDWPESDGIILDDDAPLPADGLKSVLDVDSDAGHVDLVMSGLPTLSNARYRTSALVSPNRVQATVGSGDSVLYWVNIPAGGSSASEGLVHAAIEAGAGVRLLIGPDAGSTDPSDSSAVCSRVTANGRAYCAMRLNRPAGAAPTRYWVRVRNDASSSAVISEIAYVPVSSTPALVATGPGVATAGDDIKVRATWNDASFLTGDSRVGYVVVEAAPGERVYFEPIRLRRTGSTDAPRVLAPSVTQKLSVRGGSTHGRIMLTVPPDATEVQVQTRAAAGTPGAIRLEAVHSASPVAPGIAIAPTAEAVATSTGAGLNQTLTLTAGQLSSRSGRWYIRAVNPGADRVDVDIEARVTVSAGATSVAPGSYFNPDRPGHGLFIYPAGDQWAALWYTYLEDSTTTWYYVQAPAPGPDGIWKGSIYRASWNGSANHLTEIGAMVITPRAGREFSMAVTMDGYSSEQRMTPFLTGCPNVGGNPLNASAHWFEPALSGYGFSVQVSPNYEFIASFVYDAQGRPRFLTAERGGAFAAASETIPLTQLQGFPPLGAHVTPSRVEVGALTRRYDGQGLVSIGQTASLSGAVLGNWRRSAPVAALTQRQGCNP